MRKIRHRLLATARRLDRGGLLRHAWTTMRPMLLRGRGIADPTAARALARSAFFDAEYYGAQVGIRFPSTIAAARHYKKTWAVRRWSPHPLVTTATLPKEVRDRWSVGGVPAMLAWFASTDAVRTGWSAFFEPRCLAAASLRERHSRTLEIVRTLRDDTVLPTSPVLGDVTVTWAEARRRAMEAASGLRAQLDLTKDLVHGSWTDTPAPAPASLGDVDVLITVLMTTTRDAAVVRDAIASVQAQTHAWWELVVVDRGADSDTLTALRELERDEPRLTVLELPGGGSGEAHARGLAAARGEYVALIDPTARWRPWHLSTMVTALAASEAHAGYAVARRVDENGRAVYVGGPATHAGLLAYARVDSNGLLAETEWLRAIGGFEESLRAWDDHDLILRLASKSDLLAVPVIGVDNRAAPGHTGQSLGGESPHWEWVALSRSLVDWEQAQARVDERIAGRVSIVIPSFEDVAMTLDALRALTQHTTGHDVEIIVVDNGSTAMTSLALAIAVGAFPRTKIYREVRNYNFALGSNLGVVRSTGEYVLFLNNDTAVRAGWLQPLLDRIADPSVRGVQPLLLYPDETIQSAGTEFLAADFMPTTPLVGHAAEDGRAAEGIPFQVVTAAALLMRASEVIALQGFDPIYVNGSEDVDLCLRAIEEFGGAFAVEPDSVVEHRESKTPGRGRSIQENRRLFLGRWRGRLPRPEFQLYTRLGLEVAHLKTDGGLFPAPLPVVVRAPRTATLPSGDVVPQLRWSIKNPAPGGLEGQRWGDTHFVDDLAHGLRMLGQEVVSYRRPAHTSAPTAIDDVHFALRGQFPVMPHAGKINVMWVISHPDKVTPDELRGYDLVYAASVGWAERTTRATGIRVRPLLQATDARAFGPRDDPGLPDAGADVVFVGQTRPSGPRRVVMDAIEAGIDVKVWGELWERYIPRSYIQGEYYPNGKLAGLYQRARVVLSDHHPDMAREGFIANRLFDAVASGARVVSDYVDGLDDLFHGAVQVYRSPEELAWLTSREGLAEAFPDAESLARISRRVWTAHSFEARAEVVLRDVLGVWRARQR